MKVKTKQLLAFLMSLTLLVSGLTLPAGAADTKNGAADVAGKAEAKMEKTLKADEEALGAEREESIEAARFEQIKATATTISLGEREVTITGENKDIYDEEEGYRCGTWYKFVPEQNGAYAIRSKGNKDTYVYLLDEDGQEIAHNDDGSNEGNNFLLEQALYAGRNYYYYATYYSGNETGSYTIELSQKEVEYFFDSSDKYLDVRLGKTRTVSPNVVIFSGADDLTYQWWIAPYDDNEGETGDYSKIEGATGKSYAYAVTDGNSKYLRCDINSESRGEIGRSYFRIKPITDDISLKYTSSLKCGLHEACTLSISGNTLRPDLPLVITWQKRMEESDTYETISENTVSANCVSENSAYGDFSDSLYIAQAETGYYRCVISQNGDGCDYTKTVDYEVEASNLNIILRNNLGNRSLCVNDSVTFRIDDLDQESGTPPSNCSYKWKIYGDDDAGGPKTIYYESETPENKPSVEVRVTVCGRVYINCVITTPEEKKKIDVDLEVISGLHTIRVGKEQVLAKKGQQVTLSVKANKTENVTYKWYKGEADDKYLIKGANGSSYVVTAGECIDNYICRISNGYGSQSQSFSVINSDCPVIKSMTKANAAKLEADVPVLVYAPRGHQDPLQYVYLKFVPAVTDTYFIFSLGSMDTFGVLSDQNDEEIASIDDGGGEYEEAFNTNYLIKEELTAGKTYYVKTRMLNDEPGYAGVKVTGEKYKNIAGAKIALSQTSFTSDGSAKTPGVTVTFNGKTLKNGTDYTVAYQNNVNPGTASVVVTGKGTYYGSLKQNFTIAAPTTAPMGAKVTSGGATYKVTGKNEVAFTGLKNKKKTSITIPDTVKIGGVTCKVTSMDAKALNSATKVKTLTLGKNINKIGNKAFAKMKKLRTLKIKSTNMTAKSLSKGAFKGFKGTIKVKKSKLKAYKTLFRKKGLAKTVKVKKL